MSGAPSTPSSAWNADQWESLIRTGLKMVGSVLVTLGVVDASQGAAIAGPVVDSLMALVGAGASLYGVFKSFWHHSPV